MDILLAQIKKKRSSLRLSLMNFHSMKYPDLNIKKKLCIKNVHILDCTLTTKCFNINIYL